MESEFSQFRNVRRRVMRILHPATKWGRVTVWLGILSLLLWTATLFGAKLGGWAAFTTLVFAFFGLILGFRFGFRPLVWRLRNRLIVTYLLIGVMPILLLLGWAASPGICLPGSSLPMSSPPTLTRNYSICRQPMMLSLHS